jgi:hypothetical protein
VTLASKAIINKYYGQSPKYSYFVGCSDGGREALMEVQRFPTDFDGVTAGDPAYDATTLNVFHHIWNVRANMSPDGKAVLISSRIPILHNAVLAACDKIDGLSDGIIDDPRQRGKPIMPRENAVRYTSGFNMARPSRHRRQRRSGPQAAARPLKSGEC